MGAAIVLTEYDNGTKQHDAASPLGRQRLRPLSRGSRTTRRTNVPAWDDRPVVGDLDDMGGRAEVDAVRRAFRARPAGHHHVMPAADP
jgi:hypothetical protein